MKLSSLAGPPHPAERKCPLNQTKLLFPLIFISLEDEPWEPIEPNAAPAEEPDIEEQDLSQSDWTLASTETMTHEYLTQNGKVARETIRQDVGGTVLSTKTLDFFYDDSGRPFAFNYSVDGGIASTYYYILNLQGDVVQIIDANGVLQAEYIYSPWGEIISAEGDLAEINPLRYRGYYYDSETGFYYLQSRYYDPENHRFINADTKASTGQGFVGTNAFVYANNNPILLADDGGDTAEIILDYRVFQFYTGDFVFSVTTEIVAEAPLFEKMNVNISNQSISCSSSTGILSGDALTAKIGDSAKLDAAGKFSGSFSCSVGGDHVSVSLSGNSMALSGKVKLDEGIYLKCTVAVALAPHDPNNPEDSLRRGGAGPLAGSQLGIWGIGSLFCLGTDQAPQMGLAESAGGMDRFTRARFVNLFS